MGIKGIYGQIGPGKRIAFSKLAAEYFEKHNRPLRLAIDVSIWHFQIQSGKGGSNPALRTLYYRLLRLLVLGIQPLFVFDGPNKPPFKRNARTGTQSASLPNYLTKQLLKLFSFPFHTAPGEAEAECALLQKEGIVDAVLSEDVDTLMFGCSLTLRNWSSEGTRGNKTPTHVTCYASEDTGAGEAGLDSEGMILVALMSGGDYVPAGVPRCGIKIACEAARAGFGRDLCRMSKDDKVGFRQWRERLSYELETNESKNFRVKHKALKIPENFPDMAVLGYYTNPAVSSSDKLRRLTSEISWNGEVDVLGLRKFVGEAFDWHFLSGAQKFVRGLAPALFVRRLCASANSPVSGQGINEQLTVLAICGRRTHFDSDGKPELRLKYIPAQMVGLDLELEEKEGPIENCSESDADQPEHVESATEATGQLRGGTTKSPYDATQPDRIWILEAYARVGVPTLVDAWEETMRNPKKVASKKNPTKKQGPAKIQGHIDSFLKVSKPISAPPQASAVSKQIDATGQTLGSQNPVLRRAPRAHHDTLARKPHRDQYPKKAQPIPKTPKKTVLPSPAASAEKKNPWTLSKRPADTFNVKLLPGSRYSALGIYGSSPPPGAEKRSNCDDDASPADLLPLTPLSSSSHIKKWRRPSNPDPDPSSSVSVLNSKSNPENIILLSSSPPQSHRRRRRSGRLNPAGHESPESSILLASPTYRQRRLNFSHSNGNSKNENPKSSHSYQQKATWPTSPSSISKYNPSSFPSLSPSISLPSSPSTSTPTSGKSRPARQNNNEKIHSKQQQQQQPLPLPSERLRLNPTTTNTNTSKSNPKPNTKRRKTLVTLRESLDGAWRTAEPWEEVPAEGEGRGRGRGRGRSRYAPKRVYRNVEVLDLTRC